MAAQIMGGKRILTHFTNAEGLAGITGLDPDHLVVREVIVINAIRFGVGLNSTLAQRAGDIFVTELGPDASAGQLMRIGVFGAKQQFAISFDAKEAFDSGVRVEEGWAERSIFVIPAHSVIGGMIEVIKRF